MVVNREKRSRLKCRQAVQRSRCLLISPAIHQTTRRRIEVYIFVRKERLANVCGEFVPNAERMNSSFDARILNPKAMLT